MIKCKVITIALLLFILFVREAVLTKIVKTLQFVTMLDSNRKEALFLNPQNKDFEVCGNIARQF